MDRRVIRRSLLSRRGGECAVATHHRLHGEAVSKAELPARDPGRGGREERLKVVVVICGMAAHGAPATSKEDLEAAGHGAAIGGGQAARQPHTPFLCTPPCYLQPPVSATPAGALPGGLGSDKAEPTIRRSSYESIMTARQRRTDVAEVKQ